MPTVTSSELVQFGTALLTAAGAPPDHAHCVARSLVEADLCGNESHGVMRIGRYLERVRNGTLDPVAEPLVQNRRGGLAVVDGKWGFGQVSARLGVSLAIEMCREHGQACVSLSRTNHVGRLGDYAARLAEAGFAAIVFSGGGNRGGSVAPYGGRRRLFGTNPFAMGVPGRSPLVFDFATSAIPEGKVAVARANHETLPPGCLVDKDGASTQNPQDFYDGGALLPFGGHKGSALVMMIEILATTMAGTAPIALPAYSQGNPTLILAWAVDFFVPRPVFEAHVDELLALVRGSPPAQGRGEVLLPGEIEERTRRLRLASGIPLTAGTWSELLSLAGSLGVTVPTVAPEGTGRS